MHAAVPVPAFAILDITSHSAKPKRNNKQPLTHIVIVTAAGGETHLDFETVLSTARQQPATKTPQ
jgi:hypothetical protein